MPKTILITGSTSGIGLGIAKAFAAQGHNIIFNGLEPDGATIAQQVAAETGTQHLFSPANMADPEAIRAFAKEALDRFGTIDILVSNAGIQYVSPVEDFPEEKWDAIIAINLTAAFHLTKALWPAMKAKGWGRVINIASAHGLVASEFKSAYVAAKHGLIGFTKTIALEGAPFGITANAICPGYVHTPIVDKQIADQMKLHNMSAEEVVQKVMLEKQAIKSFNSIESIAQTALFLASGAASTITGIALPVDGGWTAQ
jgi:3-hydroxybutyrate dehydrogenase